MAETAVGSPAAQRYHLSRWHVAVAVAAVAGVVLRAIVYHSALGDMSSDEAVSGLMIQHALHGQLQIFNWGLAYGGTQQIDLDVPVVWIAGQSVLAIRALPLVLNAVAALLVWRVGRRTIGEPAAWVAAALFWVWPPRLVPLVMQPGFYASDTVYTGLILLLALRVKERPDRLRVGTYGLVLGLAFWETSQIVPIEVATTAWLLWKAPRALRSSWVAVPAFVLGALPWLLWNLRHDWGSLHLQPAGETFTYLFRLRLFFSPVLPEELGLRISWSETWLVPAAIGFLLYAALLALFLYGGYRARRSETFLIYVVAAAFPFLYATASKATVESDPRYVTVLAPCLALLVAQGVTRYWRAVSVLAICLLVTAVSLHGSDSLFRSGAEPAGSPLAPRSIAPLIATLDRLHANRVFANYWIAYRLDFDTHERIVAVENDFADLEVRGRDVLPTADHPAVYPPYDREVRAAPHAFVFFRELLPRASELAELSGHGYSRYLVQGFVVYARSPARAAASSAAAAFPSHVTSASTASSRNPARVQSAAVGAPPQ